MNLQAYALLANTAIILVLIGVVVFAGLRFLSASRRNRAHDREGGDSALMAGALQDAIQKLKAQERAMAERAEASELLNTQIVNSLTAGLFVVDREGVVEADRHTTDICSIALDSNELAGIAGYAEVPGR